MNASTKLNSAIRALYKAKAKECIVKRGNKVQNEIGVELKRIIAELHARPNIAALHANLRAAHKAEDKAQVVREAAEKALSALTNAVYHQNGEFSYFCHNNKASHDQRRYEELEAKRTKTIECACHVKDSPEVLAFVADLSLVKTVGEADALLAKL